MKYLFIYPLLLLFILLQSCNKIECNELQNTFTTFTEAESKIRNTQFLFEDQINTSKSSWIRGANYFSCDKNLGYFILETEKKDYIYTNLPISVWYGFKNANSFGSYYNDSIKHKFQLYLTKLN